MSSALASVKPQRSPAKAKALESVRRIAKFGYWASKSTVDASGQKSM
ncbi:Uncharacterised protein [Vibrio cholerae]|uniref:Uncharacterized protein n=1 Tax=Vibrio cholerae TaxID=666 RepID=A0A655P6P5_VIBCL|nr:Uncharacterised protein [Vibrio cholerae]CSA99978.1 Uncharacterised protein [Vibrio cholerae]CSB07096.1 Uncharacterised protein [Vibrio cholerae]CSB16060.1 Uncharacterised protein [Vibrio cholerae]CSB47782.1 Uncharacterised protein [Vibrio cholerae]